jgi:hypothetical protein
MSEKIELDIDRVRIRDILAEAHRGCSDLLGVTFSITIEDLLMKINPFLDSNRVSIPVVLPLPSRKYPELMLEVNLRRRKIFARMQSGSKQALVNHFLKTL